MTLSPSYELANDSQFREMLNYSTPPRAGRITALEANGQVRVEMDDPDGGDVLAWPLNGFRYAVDDIVYVLFGANASDSAIVVGSRSLDPEHLSTGTVRARDAAGLQLTDSAGDSGIVVDDGGNVGIKGTPSHPLHLQAGEQPGGVMAHFAGSRAGSNINVQYEHSGAANSANRVQFNLIAQTSSAARTAAALSAGFTTLTDANRSAILQFNVAHAGASAARMALVGDLLGLGTTSPQGLFHAYKAPGGLLFWTHGAVDDSSQTLLPNAAGDVVYRVIFLFVIECGGSSASDLTALAPGDSYDVAAGSGAWRFAVAANGALTVVRQAGSGSARVAVLALWM